LEALQATRPPAGKPSFFRDLSVIKSGQKYRMTDTIRPPIMSRAPATGATSSVLARYWILADVNDHAEPVTRYFEDYPPGLTVECGSFTVSEPEIIAFAKEYDPQPFHVDAVAAATGPFGGLIASGWHTTALMMRLLVDNFVSPQSSLGAAGIDEIRWPKPVRPGDTLHVRVTVLEARRSSSKPDRGIMRSKAEVTNQNGDQVMTLTAINFILVRPVP
jgi:acyl dehydratase